MLSCLKLLCTLLVLGLALAAPPRAENNAAAKKRVERNRRQLFDSDVEDKKLDLENYAPLKVVEASLEQGDFKGDRKVNGSQVINDKDIQYYHEKNKGTVKTILEEKNKDSKLENVFYHLSYEKQQDQELTTQENLPEETTRDTTDQTLDEQDTTLADYYETTIMPEESTANNNEFFNFIDHKRETEIDSSADLTVPSYEEKADPLAANNEPNPDPDQQDQANAQDGSVAGGDACGNRGWFSNWFNWLDNGKSNADKNGAADNNAGMSATPDLDNAIAPQQFTILSPFYFGSIGLRSPSCPANRPTLVSVYFMSFCV